MDWASDWAGLRALTTRPQYLEQAVEVADKWLAYQQYFLRVPSVSVGIFYDDRILFKKGYGYANLESEEPASPGTCYRIASISKLFTATAIMQLLDDGKVQLDDPVAEYLDQFRRMKGEARKITIRHLLTHLSGMTRDGNTSHWVDSRFPSREDIRKQFGGETLYYPPLKRFKYSNFAYGLLGNVIESVTGKGDGSYRDYVNGNIIKRIHLTRTTVDFEPSFRTRMATGYSRLLPGRRRKALAHVTTGALAPATGFTSNVEDLCKFLMAHMHGGKPLITELSEREMQHPYWMSEDGSRGRGIGFGIVKVGDRTVIGHSGGFLGFSTIAAMDVKAKLGVVVLTNATDGPALALMSGVFHVFRHFELNVTGLRPRKNRRLGKYEGAFSGDWGDLEVVALGSELFALDLTQQRPFDMALKLSHLRGDEFKIEQGDEFDYIGERARFQFDSKGKVSKVQIGPNPVPAVPDGKLWKRK